MDLSRVPFAYEDLKDFENRIIYYESSRGCLFHVAIVCHLWTRNCVFATWNW